VNNALSTNWLCLPESLSSCRKSSPKGSQLTAWSMRMVKDVRGNQRRVGDD